VLTRFDGEAGHPAATATLSEAAWLPGGAKLVGRVVLVGAPVVVVEAFIVVVVAGALVVVVVAGDFELFDWVAQTVRMTMSATTATITPRRIRVLRFACFS
jgi:hypothetical protein